MSRLSLIWREEEGVVGARKGTNGEGDIALEEGERIGVVERGAESQDGIAILLQDSNHLLHGPRLAIGEQRHQQRHVVHLLQVRTNTRYTL